MDPRVDRVTEEGHRRRLSAGLDRLELWSGTATQIEKNAAYKALFAVSCGSVFRIYPVLDGDDGSEEFLVLVRPNLVIRIRLSDFNAFGIAYIGPPPTADHDRKFGH